MNDFKFERIAENKNIKENRNRKETEKETEKIKKKRLPVMGRPTQETLQATPQIGIAMSDI